MSPTKKILGDKSNFPRVDTGLTARLIKQFGEDYVPKVKEEPVKVETDQSSTINPIIMENPKLYIQVPQFGIVISRREAHKGKNMFNTLDILKEENLQMPSPGQFMCHIENVIEAARGKRQLLYADGAKVGEDVAKDLWGYMSQADRDPWGNQPCWTWLNARFSEEGGKWYIETNLRTGKDGDGKRILQGDKTELVLPFKKSSDVGLQFNEQGMPKIKIDAKSYNQEGNIYFRRPRNGTVARFCVSQTRACLGYNWDPAGWDAFLGTFTCVKGITRKVAGGQE